MDIKYWSLICMICWTTYSSILCCNFYHYKIKVGQFFGIWLWNVMARKPENRVKGNKLNLQNWKSKLYIGIFFMTNRSIDDMIIVIIWIMKMRWVEFLKKSYYCYYKQKKENRLSRQAKYAIKQYFARNIDTELWLCSNCNFTAFDQNLIIVE